MTNLKHIAADDDDDFEIVEPLPTRTKAITPTRPAPDVIIHLQPTGIPRQLLVSVIPPKAPMSELKHTPCDIVLVIDVSGSMQTTAELPDQQDQEQKEQTGLSILDLVKHASRTILEKLDEGDRLAIVTFSSNSQVVQALLPMTREEKAKTIARIEALEVQDCTNLWSGIRDGLKILDDTEQIGNVQGMFVLTDGAPNHMCPNQGYVKKLRPILERMRDAKGSVPTISTFGFGYNMKSALLRSIAEVGQGYYAFIPDAGMIGTVFVHAVANLFSTCATNATLVVHWDKVNTPFTAPSYLGMHASTSGTGKNCATNIALGNLLYGHSRNVVIEGTGFTPDTAKGATLYYQRPGSMNAEQVNSSQSTVPQLPTSALAYHTTRHELCDFLSSLFAKNNNEEYTSLTPSNIPPILPVLEKLIHTFESRLTRLQECPNYDTSDLQALLADLTCPDSTGTGQILLALRTNTPTSTPASHRTIRHARSYYTRWGMHYLPAILHQHMYQITTTFKDPGPQRYSLNSPLFQKCRDELDEAFDRLPAPKPSLTYELVSYDPAWKTGPPPGTLRMRRYNTVSNPCFSGECLVRMTGESIPWRAVEEVRVGEMVWTPRGARVVKEIVRTEVGEQEICVFGGLRITPWHPVRRDGTWVFPHELCEAGLGEKVVIKGGVVYSFMLEKDGNTDAHVVDVGGIEVTTLGHGLTDFDAGHVRSHPFFGDHDLLRKSLSQLVVDEYGRRKCGGIKRSKRAESEVMFDFITPEHVVQMSLGVQQLQAKL